MRVQSYRCRGPTRTWRLPSGDKAADKSKWALVPTASCPEGRSCPSLGGLGGNTLAALLILSFLDHSYSDASSMPLFVLLTLDDSSRRPNCWRLSHGLRL